MPDLITVAKGITSAYAPLGACIAARHVFDAFYGKPGEGREFAQVSTFGGHPVSCAAGVANLNIFTAERLWENAREVGARLLRALTPLQGTDGVGDVRGKGLLIGLELVAADGHTPADEARMAAVLGKLRAAGILAGRNSYTVSGLTNVLILAPPLILTEPEADRLAEAVTIALHETAARP
jgi:taurine-pyruvate aminotransferase